MFKFPQSEVEDDRAGRHRRQQRRGSPRARKHDVAAIDTGIDGLLARKDLMDQIDLIFDATSAKAHEHNAP